MRSLSRTFVAALAVTAAAVPGAVLGSSVASADATPSRLGVYTSSGSAGVSGHRSFETWAGAPVPYALDFAAAANGWKDMENPGWLFDPWAASNYRLVYSLQMFPKTLQTSLGGPGALAQCAAGTYNSHWRTLATNLVAKGLGDTVVRPGWEMNGDWFGWAANGRTASYIGCFRQIVTSMRAVSGQQLVFNWNPGIGGGTFPAEQAYPGDAYVDQIGVDLYDWTWAPGVYDTKATQTDAQRQAAVETSWQSKLTGDHGLRFWSAYAATHGKTLSMPEWGLANRTADEYGGGDNPYFIQKMFEFIYDPANNVSFASYFNSVSPDGEHRIFGSNAFPRSAALFTQLAQNPPVPSGGTVNCDPIPAPAPAPATNYPFWTSATGAYGGATRLDGSSIGWALYGWLAADTTIKHVQFFLDNPAATGTAARDEWTAPYDLGGSSAIGSAAVDTTGWAEGVHTVTAKVYLKDGTSQLSTASYIKPRSASCPPATTPATATLLASSTAARTDPAALPGRTVGTRLHAWATVPAGVRKVEFRLDDAAGTGAPVRVEKTAPYDLGGTSGEGSAGYDTGALRSGSHTLSAKVFFANGTTHTVTAAFTRQ